MFSIDLSNGTRLQASLDLATLALRIDQKATATALPPRPEGSLVIPLSDLKKTAETVSHLVKAFRG